MLIFPTFFSRFNLSTLPSSDLVVASAGEDRKISMWMKNGQIVGVVPQPGAEADDAIDVSLIISTIVHSSAVPNMLPWTLYNQYSWR